MRRKPLSYYLGLKYPFRVRVDPQDGYFVDFPDLDGCMTDADELVDLAARIEEVRSLWIESEYEDGHEIPAPTLMNLDAYSGKFNVRLPHSLHQALAEASADAGVSLNQYVATVLARGDAQARLERRLDELTDLLRSQGIALPDQSRVADTPGEYHATLPDAPDTKRHRKQAKSARSAS